MSETKITCPHCGQTFEITEAIRHQLDDVLDRAKTEQSESLKKQYDKQYEKELKKAIEKALKEADEKFDSERSSYQTEIEKAKKSLDSEVRKAKQNVELETERLKIDIEASRKNEESLRKQMTELLAKLSEANTARENAELNARKELLDKEKAIREEAEKRASDNFNTKIREQDETINRLREQLTAAKQVAEQGSQQLQGEILELDVEQSLRSSFSFDDITEVKKGERGSDIRQIVNEQQYRNCGLILWECKNAKTFQNSWVEKLRDELASEKAQMGVIVFNSANGFSEDYEKLSDNIWLVKPRYAIMLATLLRQILIKVFIANRNAEGKDAKVEMMYNYLTGGEFANRVGYIIESYDEMKKQLETEKRQAEKRWAAQEKILLKTINNLYGMGGDLQGIIGKEVIALPAAEEE